MPHDGAVANSFSNVCAFSIGMRKVTHLLFSSGSGEFIACLIHGEEGEILTVHPIRKPYGLPVAYPPLDLSEEESSNIRLEMAKLTED